MRDYRDAKAMAQTLREALKAKSVALTHSESLELVSIILGFHDWNVLSARIQSEDQAPVAEPPALPISAGARLPVVPLRDAVLFPKVIARYSWAGEESKCAVECAMAGDQRVLIVTQRRAADDNPAPQGLYRVGVTASVIERTTVHDGTIRLWHQPDIPGRPDDVR